MTWDIIIVKILHIVLAALWLGAPLGLSRGLKRGLASGQEGLRLAADDLKYRATLAAIGGFGVLVTGLVLVFQLGGFKVLGPRYHAALGLVVIGIAISFVFGPLNKRVLAAVADFSEARRADAAIAIKHMGIVTHIEHTLWLASLVLMLLPA